MRLNLAASFVVWSAVSIAAAAVSRYGLEKPLNDLGIYFPYDSRRVGTPLRK
jgi:hypothetical protein